MVIGEYRQIFPVLFSVIGVLFWVGANYDITYSLMGMIQSAGIS